MAVKLTEDEKDVLNFCIRQKKRMGHMPSSTDVAFVFGITMHQAQKALQSLYGKGCIEQDAHEKHDTLLCAKGAKP
jgi:hypothetical protein